MERRYKIFRFAAYSLEFLLLFIIESTPFLLPELFGSKPMLLIPAAVTVALLEDELPAMFFGLAAGLITDLAIGQSPGFFALALTPLCFLLARIFREYMVVSFLNALAFISVVTAGLICLYFLFFFVFAGKPNARIYFFNHYISRMIYSIACGIPLFYLNKFLYRNLR